MSEMTPSMAQFHEIKAAHPDCLLFFQMGDFYELFFDDAVAAAAALDIALTRRGKHLGDDIPMCGVPLHAATNYLLTLIRKGFRVAVCDQIEDPAEARRRGSKAVVRREVTRVVTPGTLTEESLLDARRHNFLAAWAEVRGDGALAWADVSTGDLGVARVARPGLGPMLARIAPREVLVPDQAEPDRALEEQIAEAGAVATPLGPVSFNSASADKRLRALFRVATLDAFGAFERCELAALGALADYLELTQKGRLPLLRPPVRETGGGVMRMDAGTRRNLELTRTLAGGREGSLLAAIDRTLTGAGARLLETRLSAPLTDPRAVAERLDAVERLVEDRALCGWLREALAAVPEIERALSRLVLDRGGPRDLAAIRAGLAQAGEIAAALAEADELPSLLNDAGRRLAGHDELVGLLDAALVAEPPLLTRDGGFVAPGHDPALDEARRLRDQGRGVVAGMQADYAARAGVNALKIRHNNVLGYFIEVTAQHGDKMLRPPLSETFIHRQTLANAVRFTTVDLAELESKIVNAGARALEIEKRIFAELRAAVLDRQAAIGEAARALADIDLAAAGAVLAVEERWVRPTVEAGRAFAITAGRHPVVERALKRQGGSFVANDCELSAEAGGPAPIWLVTGPNMAGKSTFLRQNALIAILAQAGMYVPGRGGAGRGRRPAVQPGGGGRRSGPGPVHLHGRDGRDGGHPEPGGAGRPGHPRRDRAGHGDLGRPVHRLGDARASARGEPVPGPFRHALSRAGRALRAPAPPLARRRRRPRVGGRGHLPARGAPGRRGPLLWRPGGAAGRPARERRRPRPRRAGKARGRRPRGPGRGGRAGAGAAALRGAAGAGGPAAPALPGSRGAATRNSPRIR